MRTHKLRSHEKGIVCLALLVIPLGDIGFASEPPSVLRDERLTGSWRFLWCRFNGGPEVMDAAGEPLKLTYRDQTIHVDHGNQGKETWNFQIVRLARGKEAGRAGRPWVTAVVSGRSQPRP